MWELSCVSSTLAFLPSLPANLRILNCFGNPLETLPELPSTLQQLKSELPIYYEFDEEIQEEIQHGGRMIYDGMYPDLVGAVNYMIVRAATYVNQESKKRCNKRCAQYKEEIMMKAWRPSRMEMLIEMGYDVEDM